jgi:catalase
MHTLLWALSNHGIPRSYRHMDGFGVHTFRFVTEQGSSKLIKFHWKTTLGKAGIVWEEAQVVSDIDYHRKDLFEAIERGHYPEWEVRISVFLSGHSTNVRSLPYKSWTNLTS